MIQTERLQPFTREEFAFEGAWCFRGTQRAYLLSDAGTGLVLSNSLARTVAEGNPPEDLAFKLYQRGFGSVYGRHRINPGQEPLLPRFFMIDFTTQCNCNCIYCLRHFENVGQTISEAALRDICGYIIDYCRQNEIDSIGFQPWGGEPLIALEKILLAKQLFAQAGIRADFSVQTNGLLLSPETYRKLKEHDIGIGISIDGDRESHDAHRVDVRGNVTHEQILRRLAQLREIDPQLNPGTISVNSQYTAPHIRHNIAYLTQQLQLRRLKFNLVHPNGADFDRSMLITDSQIPRYVEDVLEGILEQRDAGIPVTEANIMDKAMNLLCRPDDDLCHSRGCRGGYGFISFSQEGKIYPCEMIGSEENCMGSIYDGIPLPDLLERAQTRIPYFAPRALDECGGCPWLPFCRGGCKASAMAYGRHPRDIDPMECAVNRALYPRLVELLLEEPERMEQLVDGRVRCRV